MVTPKYSLTMCEFLLTISCWVKVEALRLHKEDLVQDVFITV